MNIEELRKLIKNSTSVLVLDKGEPVFVVMGYDSYKQMTSGADNADFRSAGANIANGQAPETSSQQSKEGEILDRLNKDILALKHQIEMEEGQK